MKKTKHVGACIARPHIEENAKNNVGEGPVSARKERGITLIALIITIIVLLILTAVVVDIAVDGKLFDKAQDAVNKTNDKVKEQQGRVDELMGELDRVESNQKEENTAGNGGTGGVNLPTVTAGERAPQNSTYTDSEGKKAVIPEGFTVSGVKNETTDETTIDDGLVIYLIPEGETVDWTDGEEVAEAQKTYDQFVWIPIKNTTDANAQDINDMYICQGKTSSNGTCEIKVVNGIAECQTEAHKTLAEDGTTYKNTLMAGYLYSDDTMTTRYETYTSGSGNREPDTVEDEDGYDMHLGFLSSILEADVAEDKKEYTSIENFKEKLQEEYNEVVKSVYENQGFYVGRYETSGMARSETDYDVAVVAGVLPSSSHIGWYHEYAQQKNYAKDNNLTVGSTMIQGAAYNQVMKFVDTEDYEVTTAGNVGHDFSNEYNTGSQSTDQSKNIFDLEGNVFAWTTEACDTYCRVFRGGDYCGGMDTDSWWWPDGFESSRCGWGAGEWYTAPTGSLVQLYVK